MAITGAECAMGGLDASTSGSGFGSSSDSDCQCIGGRTKGGSAGRSILMFGSGFSLAMLLSSLGLSSLGAGKLSSTTCANSIRGGGVGGVMRKASSPTCTNADSAAAIRNSFEPVCMRIPRSPPPFT
mgnify:CR=1 FL=1